MVEIKPGHTSPCFSPEAENFASIEKKCQIDEVGLPEPRKKRGSRVGFGKEHGEKGTRMPNRSLSSSGPRSPRHAPPSCQTTPHNMPRPFFLCHPPTSWTPKQNGQYSVANFCVANTIVQVPFVLLVALCCCTPVYWITDMNDDPTRYMYVTYTRVARGCVPRGGTAVSPPRGTDGRKQAITPPRRGCRHTSAVWYAFRGPFAPNVAVFDN